MTRRSKSRRHPVLTAVWVIGGATLITSCQRSPSAVPAPESVRYLRKELSLDPLLKAEQEARPRLADPKAREQLADAYTRGGDLTGAALTLQPLLQAGPSEAVRTRFVEVALELGWLQEAEAALQALGSPSTALLLRVAGAHVEHGNAQRAAALLHILSDRNLNADELLTGATLWLRAGRPREAAAWADRGVKLQPERPETRLLAVRAHLAAGTVEAARKLLPRWSADEPILVRFWRGRVEVASSDPALRNAGIRDLQQVSAADPANGVAAFEAGRECVRSKRFAPATGLLTLAIRAGYQQVLAYDLLARAYQGLGYRREEAWARGKVAVLEGRLKDAQALFRRSLELDPSRPAAYLELAETLSADRQPTAALKVLQRAQRVAPKDVDLTVLKAAVLGRLERVAEQTRELETAAAFSEERANEPLGELGKLYYNSQQFELAQSTLTRAVQHEDGDAYSHLYLGLTYARQIEDPVKADRAAYHLVRSALAKPDYFYPWINAGSAFQRMGYPSEAAVCYRRAIQGDGRWEGPYLSLAQVLQKENLPAERQFVLKLYGHARRLETRRHQLDNATTQRPRDPQARFALGDQLFRDGKVDEAFPELFVAAALRPNWKEAQARLAEVCAVLEYEDLRRKAADAAR